MTDGCFGSIMASRVGPRRGPKTASVIANVNIIEDRRKQAPGGLARLVPARLARDLSDRNQEATWVSWAGRRMQMRCKIAKKGSQGSRMSPFGEQGNLPAFIRPALLGGAGRASAAWHGVDGG